MVYYKKELIKEISQEKRNKTKAPASQIIKLLQQHLTKHSHTLIYSHFSLPFSGCRSRHKPSPGNMAALGYTEGAQAEPLGAQDCMGELPLAGT